MAETVCMTIAIYTSDLNEDNGHLMPWRTVLEVAAHSIRLRQNAIVLSGCQNQNAPSWQKNGVPIKSIQKPYNRAGFKKLADFCRAENIKVMYWPLDWKIPQTSVLQLENVGLRIIWYVPGAYYHFSHVLKAIPYIGFAAAMPYLVQTLMPKRYYVRQLLKNGVRPLIMMSEYSRTMIIKVGYPEKYVFHIPPGKPFLDISNDKSSIFDEIKHRIGGRPYFLFFGPPQAIRGIIQMLLAFKHVARNNTDVCLVCLFRSDKGLVSASLRARIQDMNLEDRIFCAWDSVSQSDLDFFLLNCYVVLKPFLLVPSEIPLAVIETAGHGKPVISTGPDGTGVFAAQFGIMVPPANAKALATAMLKLLNDKQLYKNKCNVATQVYADHPTWEAVANQWLRIADLH